MWITIGNDRGRGIFKNASSPIAIMYKKASEYLCNIIKKENNC
ncbi:hypothetical protein CSCING10_009430 [[Clostridium] scindens]|nr:hypothetical protein CSCING10_009430 [[Clostridium] scindens]